MLVGSEIRLRSFDPCFGPIMTHAPACRGSCPTVAKVRQSFTLTLCRYCHFTCT
jgi:hypothetical protein